MGALPPVQFSDTSILVKDAGKSKDIGVVDPHSSSQGLTSDYIARVMAVELNTPAKRAAVHSRPVAHTFTGVCNTQRIAAAQTKLRAKNRAYASATLTFSNEKCKCTVMLSLPRLA